MYEINLNFVSNVVSPFKIASDLIILIMSCSSAKSKFESRVYLKFNHFDMAYYSGLAPIYFKLKGPKYKEENNMFDMLISIV